MGIERRGPPGTLRMDPSGSPHRGAPCTEETPLRTEESRLHEGASPPSARRSRLWPASGPAHTLVLPVTAPFLLVVADSSHRRSLGTPEVSHQPLCLPTLRQAPCHSSPGPQPQFPRTLGQTRSPGFCSCCCSPPHDPQGRGLSVRSPGPQLAAGSAQPGPGHGDTPRVRGVWKHF